MPRSSNESTISRSFLSVSRELENLLSPADQTFQVGVEGKSIEIIYISLSLKMEHTSTTGRGGEYTGVIPIHHICVGYGGGAGRGNTDDAENSIILSSSLSY